MSRLLQGRQAVAWFTTKTPVFVPLKQAWYGGAGRNRTDDLLRAKQALSQLSYSPVVPDGGPGKT